ncbi:MAG: DPP IV N-terminal domain-containing protein, partial [Pseudomonadota bacterium]
IAFLQIDTQPIEPSTRFEVSGDLIEMIEQRYPYAGTANVTVKLGLVRLDSGAIEWINVLDETGNEDLYIPRVTWLPDASGVAFQRQSRDQKTLDLVVHRFSSPTPSRLVRETSDHWINLHDDLHFLTEMDAFIWSSERSGYRHLYLIGMDGELIRPLTAGDWPVQALAGVDEDLGRVYFTAYEQGPTEQHLYRQSLATETPRDVTAVTRAAGWHEVSMDASATLYLDQFSSTEQPPQWSLHSADGERITWLSENRITSSHPYYPYLDDHQPTEFGVIQSEDRKDLHYRIIQPAGFSTERKYPVFVHVYGGPTSRVVLNRWGRRQLIDQYMAQLGYVVFSLDNRGIVGQGMTFQAPAYQQLGRIEVVDQMAGLDYLRTLSFVDPDRIGVFGWSYGGYMSLMMLMQHPGSFAAGVAVAPVTDWALYDTHYTERYLGMPRDASGQPTPAYQQGNVLSYANQLSDPLLLIHGMADDNVLFTHSTMLMQQLQEQSIAFELMTYPGEKHGISGSGQRLHVYRHWVDFFNRTLLPEAMVLVE